MKILLSIYKYLANWSEAIYKYRLYNMKNNSTFNRYY